MVSEHFRTHHTLVEYPSDDVQTIRDLVIRMDEPFCDLGINIATDILGKASSGTVAYTLTGDGGDELFGGHPVYLADGAGRMMDRVPGLFKRPFLWAGSKLQDTDKKKDFRVKWKRFSYSMQFPSSLLSHRWRVYYTPGELQELIQADSADRLIPSDPYAAFLSVNGEADGEAFLDRALYSDYQTVVGFYLSRMDLIRHYGIESRFPLLDHRLVEYGATIPPHLKIRGNSDTKYILKQTMKDILPHDIVFRKDKLGHSIPMKNWMREPGSVQSLLMELCSSERLKKRGLFREETVKQYMDEHVSKRRNHSHRLWALMVLELWFQQHMDG
jgi:asparagine synthase (glutamine-hydrolysing)